MKKRLIYAFLLLLSSACSLSSQAQDYEEKDFQLGFVTPVGTNGTHSYSTVNKVSFNVLGGHSYGNTAFEFGSLYNINTHITKGFQFAGIANYTGCSDGAAQMAGITNIASDGVSTFQLAGIANIANEMSGLQMAGIVNIAKRLRGVQLGLVNISDECEGVPVGLINIVKKNGKHEFELSFSETLNTAVSFRLGTDKLYTIFSGGVRYLESPTEYALGIGFGTHINWKNNWGNQIELVGYSVTKDGSFNNDGVNMLTQLRLPISKELSCGLKLFAGPVVNMTISDVEEDGDDSIGPWNMWSSIHGDTHLKGWVGLVAGVRF